MKKNASILLAAVLLTGTLAGCGQTTASSSSLASSSKAEQTSAVTKKDEPTATVKWYVAGVEAADHDLVMADLNTKLKEKINVELDLQIIAPGEFNDKMKLISTSGEDYDLTFTAGWRNNFYDNMAREAFLPLDDLIASEGKDIIKAVPDWLLDVATVNGKLYAVPNQQVIAYQTGFMIQKQYIDKYKFDVSTIKTLEDIEPFLKLLKENEPDLIPLRTGGQLGNTYRSDYEGFANYNVLVKKGDTSLTALPIIDTDAYIAQCNLQNDWYNKGYYRKDIMTVTDDSADVKANKYVVSYNTYKPGGDAEQTAASGVEMVAVPIGEPYIDAVTGNGTMTAINVNSKNPEAAMRLLNCVYTDKEVFNELLFGIEGTHYTKSAPDRVEPVKDTKYNYGTLAWTYGNQFNAWYLPGQKDGIWEETDKMNREAKVAILRGFTLDSAPIQAELAQLSAVDKEYLNAIYVAKDVDAFIKELKDKKEKAGLTKVVEEVQKQIDTWAKANGKK